MKNILIPTDFSDNAHNAVKYALEYFGDIPVNFFLLHVSHQNQPIKSQISVSFFQSSGDSQLLTNPDRLLQEEIEQYKIHAKNPHHTFTAVRENMILVEAVRKQIAERDIELIVMGTKGGALLEDNEMGSYTYDVITKVKCPIMVIPENALFKGIDNIAFVTDYNCIYRNKVISTLSEALHLHHSPLRVLHIRPKSASLTPSQIDNKGFLHYFFKETKHSFHYMDNTNVEEGIQDFVSTWEINCIALVAKNLNFIQRLMMRPTQGGFNYHSEIPFLVLHE